MTAGNGAAKPAGEANRMDAALRLGRQLAQQVVALECARDESKSDPIQSAENACEKLRAELGRLVGVSGYSTLLAHARTQAMAEDACLEALQINLEGAITWVSNGSPAPARDKRARALEALLAHTIGLLIVFLGDAVSLRLLRNVWPEALVEGANSEAEGDR
jgi:hypothetical protein